VGLPPDQEQSYAHYMGSTLFDHVNVTESQAHIPHGMASDVDGHITAMPPAAMVQMHRFGHVIIDAAAASELDCHQHGILESKEE
jgi:6-phosphogluconolactonase/glucosamine-6-phosphate isomerase/deaminase